MVSMEAKVSRALPRAQAPFVQSHPFVAEFLCCSRAAANDTIVGRVFRDRAGRTRTDYLACDQELRIIDDMSARTVVIADVTNRLLQREQYGAQPAGWSFRVGVPVYTNDRQVVRGVECIRIALVRPPGVAAPDPGTLGELWVSESQGIVMKDEDPAQGWIWEITMIDFRDPDPGTFDIPSDFEELED